MPKTLKARTPAAPPVPKPTKAAVSYWTKLFKDAGWGIETGDIIVPVYDGLTNTFGLAGSNTRQRRPGLRTISFHGVGEPHRWGSFAEAIEGARAVATKLGIAAKTPGGRTIVKARRK